MITREEFCEDCIEYSKENGCSYWETSNPSTKQANSEPYLCIHYNYNGVKQKGYCSNCNHTYKWTNKEEDDICKCCGTRNNDNRKNWMDDWDDEDEEYEDDEDDKQNYIPLRDVEGVIIIYNIEVNHINCLYAIYGKRIYELWGELGFLHDKRAEDFSVPAVCVEIPVDKTKHDMLDELRKTFKEKFPSLRDRPFHVAF